MKLALALSALTLSCAPSQAACPACPNCGPERATVASASSATTAPPTPTADVAPSTPPSASASAAPAAPDDPYCHAGSDDASYGGWEATPGEVTAAIQKMQFVCAPAGWLSGAVSDCMARIGKTRVVVRSGVMDGDHATAESCDLAVTTVTWNGRKWIALSNAVRDGASFYDFITSVELTAHGPVLSTTGCEREPTGKPGGANKPITPAGWATFPPDVQQRLCH